MVPTNGLYPCHTEESPTPSLAETWVVRMRLIMFAAVVAFGATIGAIAAAGDDTSTKVAMAFVGSLFALPVAALLTRRRKGSSVQSNDEPIDTLDSTSPRSLSANYWRDRGYPPFMKPSDGDPDRHLFDPDRLS